MRFDDPAIAAVYRAIFERRDMRHFTSAPVDPATLARLLRAAHHAPSVGFMQPWRFIRITDPALRTRIHALVEAERRATADALGERQDEFMRLKVEGVCECGELLVVALADGRERHVFGRRTLPEMDLASAACAIQNMWLAARAEGLGMGWVSLFDVDALRALLGMPDGAKPIAVLCLGHVDAFYAKPMLEEERWAARMPIEACVSENGWNGAASEASESIESEASGTSDESGKAATQARNAV
ncbi:5,6-dimethylbenzimidazole synthase [Burkholderia ubonensis]|uniref:5,6-dimethylbenzimidazole synthase n=1 Tax=Burkholderia ubonensis TaxID=101571 RepID=A0AB74D8U8_9BURK|nr:5,6-dimethylbenzimidazole synthase [Burkholderia ubonensis]PAJ77146.1 5,6-dimethylbenzimidazole synthase [Burkholderia ubonensis]PAJ83474.1 5,6-dimethylbenzimidazole synthase [Burkholderia ubonensis]PAJ90793.1 5,6-dimethylbenzimidazole synthase [Burkholderia ubonensis]PAJ96848.1 5,6-dimethylbenzimidazole synthase [Burkholderia ubonensis]PAK03856.1 5,6-dimethylbenzimidazole synthase [Burkholderia ubonensis]